MKALVYLRGSQDRPGEAVEVLREREDCLKRCTDRRWEVVAVESDNDTSGKSAMRRPGFEALLEQIRERTPQVIVAWSLDRLTRNSRDEMRLYEACLQAKVSLSTVHGADVDMSSAAGRRVAESLASSARREVEQRGERQRNAVAQAVEQGRRIGGRRPFGYEPDGMTIRDSEAMAIRSGYATLLAGVSLAQIARDWNELGHRTPQLTRTGEPSAWRADTARGVLLNARYAGLRSHAPPQTDGRRRPVVVGRAVWPPIVAEDTYHAAVELLTATSRAKPTRSARFLLTGLATCGICGDTLHGGRNARGRRIYRCSTRKGHVGRQADPVEAYLREMMIARLSRPHVSDLLADRDKPNSGAFRREARLLHTRIKGLRGLVADGMLTSSQARKEAARLRGAIAQMETEMVEPGRGDILGVLVAADDVAKVWDGLRPARQRAAIDLLCTVVIHPAGPGMRPFDPETVRITWKSPG